MTPIKIFEGFQLLKVLIVGDVMIDRYLMGSVDRISPEAPVPILNLQQTVNRLGGAANVALNVKALGATPYLCTVIGDDDDAALFENLCAAENLLTEGVIRSANRVTTVKTRLLAKGQQLLRCDAEITTDLTEADAKLLLAKIISIIEKEKINILIFQDYNKGVLTQSVIQTLIQLCQKHNIPTAVDPKKRNFFAYKGVTLFKPNLKEIADSIGFQPDATNIQSLTEAATLVEQQLGNAQTLITLSEKGMFLKNKEKNTIIPARPRNIADVCGAGDTVISVVSLGLALGLATEKAVFLANLAGGIVCEHIGVVPIDKKRLFEEYQTLQKG
jgi:rfaE bifunctional protein kinase chain/domain